MTPEREREQAAEDIAFLLERSMQAGSASFTADRWTGASSNYLVSVCYEWPHPLAKPSDRSDLDACRRTWKRLPPHRRTEKGERLLCDWIATHDRQQGGEG